MSNRATQTTASRSPSSNKLRAVNHPRRTDCRHSQLTSPQASSRQGCSASSSTSRNRAVNSWTSRTAGIRVSQAFQTSHSLCMSSITKRVYKAETRSHSVLEAMHSKMQWMTRTAASKLSISTKANRGSTSPSQKACHPSKTQWVAEGPRIKIQTIIISKMDQDRTQTFKASSNHMEIAYLIVSSNSRPVRELNHMDRICWPSQIRLRKAERLQRPRRFRPSQRMHTRSCRSRCELSRQNSLKINLNTRKTFLSS